MKQILVLVGFCIQHVWACHSPLNGDKPFPSHNAQDRFRLCQFADHPTGFYCPNIKGQCLFANDVRLREPYYSTFEQCCERHGLSSLSVKTGDDIQFCSNATYYTCHVAGSADPSARQCFNMPHECYGNSRDNSMDASSFFDCCQKLDAQQGGFRQANGVAYCNNTMPPRTANYQLCSAVIGAATISYCQNSVLQCNVGSGAFGVASTAVGPNYYSYGDCCANQSLPITDAIVSNVQFCHNHETYICASGYLRAYSLPGYCPINQQMIDMTKSFGDACTLIKADSTNDNSCWNRNGQVRLLSRPPVPPNAGLVEMFYEGTWAPISDSGMDNETAQVLCRWLNLPTTNPVYWTLNNNSAKPISIDQDNMETPTSNITIAQTLSCSSSANTAEQCDHSPWLDPESTLDDNYVFIHCAE